MLCFVGTVQSGTFVMFFRYKIKFFTNKQIHVPSFFPGRMLNFFEA
jgi:hypothetical protein